MKQCLSDEHEHEPSRVITTRDYKDSPSHGRNVLRNGKTEQLESNSRDYIDLARQVEQPEAIFVALKGERYSEDGRDMDANRHGSSPLSQIGESEAYVDNVRKVVYLDDEREEMRNEYHFGNDSRMHFDVHERDIVVDQDRRVVELRQVCLNKGEAAHLDNERRDVNMHYKTQQLKKDYDSGMHFDLKKDYESGTDDRMRSDVRRLDTVVDHEDARGLRYIGVSLNDRKEAYLQCESQQRLKDHEKAPYGIMHSNVNKSDFLVNREDARALKLRGVAFDDGKKSYLDNESGDGYLRYRNQQRMKDYDYGIDDGTYRDVNSSEIIVDHGDARALERRGVSFNDVKEPYRDNERRDVYRRYENRQLKKGYNVGINDRMYHDINRLQIVVDHEVARGPELRELSFNGRSEAHLDKERRDAYMRYEIQQRKKDYDSVIDDRMCHDVNTSEIVVNQEVARDLERREVSLYDGREAYLHSESQQFVKDLEIDSYGMMHPNGSRSTAGKQDERRGVSLYDERAAYLHHESHQLVKDHEIDSYGMMHPDVSRSSVGKQDDEARRYMKYHFDDRKQVSLDDECLQLRNGGHVKAHDNMRYPDGRQEVYRSNDEILHTRDGNGLRSGVVDEAGEVIHEKMARDFNYEKPYSGRFRDHEVAYNYRDKLGNYAVEGGTSTKPSRYLADERNFGNDGHAAAPRPRISVKERLGRRLKDSRVPVKYRLLHQVKNPKVKGKSHNRRN
ncbi:hypothetical protein AALP_AA5G074700 [Arabis alpina]|uniref:Uncharacterized protein n=1 Tax=Arabis alpina TaxID=50452 RepID=A0A087GVJ1_ARAAL|nr:hypothetical protein AALP_AA5G074700 [Arabis alpina]